MAAAGTGSAENEVVANVETDIVDVSFYVGVRMEDELTRSRPSPEYTKDTVRVSWQQLWSDPTPTIYSRLIFEANRACVDCSGWVFQVGVVGTVPQNMSCNVVDRLLIHTLATSPEHPSSVQVVATWVASTGYLEVLLDHHATSVSHIEIVRLSPHFTSGRTNHGSDWVMCSPMDLSGMPLLGTFRS